MQTPAEMAQLWIMLKSMEEQYAALAQQVQVLEKVQSPVC